MDKIYLYADLDNIPKSIYPNFFDHNKHIHFLKDIQYCDFVLLPHWEVIYEYSDRQYIDKGLKLVDRSKYILATESLIAIANKYNKKLIVFHFSDLDKKITLPNSLVFKTSLYCKQRENNEFSLPSNKGDLIKEYKNGQVQIRSKEGNPTVGFTGSSRPLQPNLVDALRLGLNLFNKMTGQKK
jgi:hypothetical protein